MRKEKIVQHDKHELSILDTLFVSADEIFIGDAKVKHDDTWVGIGTGAAYSPRSKKFNVRVLKRRKKNA